MRRTRFTIKSTLTKILLVLVCFVQMSVLLFAPVPAHAQWSVIVSEDLPAIRDSFEEFLKESALTSLLGGLLNGVSYFARKVAYDTAKYVGSGGKGQSALVFKDGPGEYFANTVDEAAGEAISSFGTEAFGIDICQIPDLKVNILLKIGLSSLFTSAPAKPNCTLTEFRDNWSAEAFEKRYGPGGSRFLAETFNASIKVEQSDFGVALSAMESITRKNHAAGLNANLERLIGEGLKDVKGLISGTVVTPAHILKQDIELASTKYSVDLTTGQIAGLYGTEALNAIPMAASVFINTLAGELLNQLFTEGLFPETPGDGRAIGSFYASNIINNRQAVEQALSFLLAPTIKQVDEYKIVDKEYASCPDNPGLNNCVIDRDFQEAINRADRNRAEALTIAGAIRAGLLHGDWPLISPRREEENTDPKNCYVNKYCYSNIQKLRKVRIVPLGFEIAALKSDPDQPWTLGQVVNGYHDCNAQNQPDAAHPFCHLLDPNWVIRAPQARCQTQVYGPELIDRRSSDRREECVDVQTCIQEDDKGKCQAWGYCTREKNVWRLSGDMCPKEYATCVTYRNAANNATASYLSRTVDFGSCSDKTVGCLAYSLEQTNGTWTRLNSRTAQAQNQLKEIGRNQLAYFNKNIQTCPAGADGCSAFFDPMRDEENGQFVRFAPTVEGVYRPSANVIHLKKAPDYLGCYDANPTTPEINWPRNRAELNNVSQDARCNAYAPVCAPEEVGCDSFTPLAGGDTVPAVVSNNNLCARACVGYSTFKQEATRFEPERRLQHFIPAMAASCSSQHVGCEEFTNIEAPSAGGEQKEYYTYIKYCEKPNGNNAQTYFSWEGSIQEGYVLRTHRLLRINIETARYISGLAQSGALQFANNDTAEINFPVGAPGYADDTAVKLQENYRACNERRYTLTQNNPLSLEAVSPDCRALYTEAGQVYYRLVSQTVSVSDQCHRLRKTDTRLVADPAITDAATCAQRGGSFVNNSCQRCYQGGRYENGQCIYQTIASEASSCPAAANGCRAYTGNAGNNVNPRLIFDTFEPAATSNPADAARALTQAGANWTDQANVRVVSEAVVVGQHSLQVNRDVVERTIASRVVQPNRWYELSFWARGTAQLVDVTLHQEGQLHGRFTFDAIAENIQPGTIRIQPVTITGEWQEYKLGPVQFTGTSSTAPVILRFTRTAAPNTALGPYFLDQVRMGVLEDNIFVIKNSWQRQVSYQGRTVVADAPLACDTNPTDALPGTALGCSAYTNRSQQTYFVTGFASLCREKAVGCQPLYDTKNTVQDKTAVVYNLWCPGAVGTECTASVTVNNTPTILGYCTPVVGTTGCFIDKNATRQPNNRKVVLPTGVTIANLNTVNVVPSTMHIPADDAPPVYLVNKKEYQCQSGQLGCQKVGLQEEVLPGDTDRSYSYSDKYVLNNPATYGTTLCDAGTVGCGEFTANNNTYYFKNPETSGGRFCRYKTDVLVGGQKRSGWFKDNVGTCRGSASTLCRADADCGTAGVCEPSTIGLVPCYPGYLENNNVYGIWSNQSLGRYDRYVGRCEPQHNNCVELRDPSDTATSPQGQTYYRIFNDKLTAKVGECQGQASLTAGCVLFDRTDQPNKLYSSRLTYDRSARATPQYSLVALQSAPARESNDTNVLLKVNRDRECAEWLACRSKVPVTDERGGKIQLCSQYKACNATIPGQECTNFVDRPVNEDILSADTYARRDVSWVGRDFSGYSILDRFAITNYVYLAFENEESQYLAYEENPSAFSANSGFANLGCAPSSQNINAEEKDGSICGLIGAGRCYQGRCIRRIDGRPFSTQPQAVPQNLSLEEKRRIINQNVALLKRDLVGGSCKGFPEANSPYPAALGGTPAVLTSTTGRIITAPQFCSTDTGGTATICGKQRVEYVLDDRNPFFTSANICQGGDCSCQYQKITYKNATADYWQPNATLRQIPDGICVGGGAREGAPCVADPDCRVTDQNGTVVSSGTCSRQRQRDSHIGLYGFCLEPDLSRPINGRVDPTKIDPVTGRPRQQDFACLTWLPIQTSALRGDIFNRFLEAGYNPDIDKLPPGGAQNTQVAGEVMCTVASNGVVYDQAKIPALTSIEEFNRRYIGTIPPNTAAPGGLSFFNTVGFPFLIGSGATSDDRFTCEDVAVTLPNYRSSLCLARGVNNDPSMNEVYRATQAWAWSQLGTNASVLRIESVENDFLINNQFVFPDVPRSAADCNDPAWGTCETNVGGLTVGTVLSAHLGLRNRDLPTLLHPPRLWDRPDDRCTTYHYGTARSDVFGTLGLSPEPLQFRRNGSGGTTVCEDPHVYRSPHERNLRESEIGQVYFVPIYYPEGLRVSWSPRLMSTELALDIQSLRQRVPPAARVGNAVTTVRSVEVTGVPNARFHPEINFGANQTTQMSVFDDNDVAADQAGWRVWNYALERGRGPGLISFDQYRISQSDLNPSNNATFAYANFPSGAMFTGGTGSPAADPRNQIQRRYVAVFMHQQGGNWPNFVSDATLSTPPSSPDTDPFRSRDCSGSWVAIGMDFNANGEFLGYISRSCMGNSVNFAVVATFPNKCTEFAKVYDVNPPGGLLSGTSNKAWTQRVWQNSLLNATTPLSHPLALYSAGVIRDTVNKPFGSLNLAAQSVTQDAQGGAPSNYIFNDPQVGIPYSCVDPSLPNINITRSDCTALLDFQYGRALVDVLSPRTRQNAREAVGQLFAYAFVVQQYDVNNARFNPVTTGYAINGREAANNSPGNTSIDASGFISSAVQTERLLPPMIYSLNPARCFERAGRTGTTCAAGEQNNITVSGRNGTMANYDNDQDNTSDEDEDRDGEPDAHIARGAFGAEVKFFAWADDNRMPIRRVIVDWGDGTIDPPGLPRGLYKNHKPFCSANNPTETTPSVFLCTARLSDGTTGVDGLTCRQNTDCPAVPQSGAGVTQSCLGSPGSAPLAPPYNVPRFGNATRACVAQPFEFSHAYSCTRADILAGPNERSHVVAVGDARITEGTRRRLRALGLGDSDFVCYYKPKVQVTDNWGWCNGTCGDVNNDGVISGNERAGCYDNPNDENECRTPAAWTQYRGAIIVLPPQR